jgi:hypothetical protein
MSNKAYRSRGALGVWLSALAILTLAAHGSPASYAQADHPPPATQDPATAAGVSADWWATAQANIQRAEYNVTWQEQTYLPDLPAAYQAPNRANNLRTYFGPGGLIVIPRTWIEGSAEPPWRWELRLISGGREGSADTVPAASLEVRENLVTYRREAPAPGARPGLVESYRNDEAGLAQGFVIERGESALRSPSPLILEMALAGSLAPRLTADGAAVEFLAGDGLPVLRYGPLVVEDAAGQPLAGRLSLADSALAVTIDDTAAVYPIEVEAAVTGLPATWNWRAEANAAASEFGYAVSTAGDVNGDGYSDVIVGAPKYDGGQADEGRAVEGLPSREWICFLDQGRRILLAGLGFARVGRLVLGFYRICFPCHHRLSAISALPAGASPLPTDPGLGRSHRPPSGHLRSPMVWMPSACLARMVTNQIVLL